MGAGNSRVREVERNAGLLCVLITFALSIKLLSKYNLLGKCKGGLILEDPEVKTRKTFGKRVI